MLLDASMMPYQGSLQWARELGVRGRQFRERVGGWGVTKAAVLQFNETCRLTVMDSCIC